MLTADSLVHLSGVRHGFFTRAGGVSQGAFAAMNCGLGSRDDPEAVRRNRQLAMSALGRQGEDLVTVAQVHSNRVVVVTQAIAEDQRPEADGLVTKVPGVALGVLAADCAPLLFVDPKAGVIGAAHAGWRGALDGIAEATLLAMESLGARRSGVYAAVGPCIAQGSYEVGPEFVERFQEADPANDRFFCSGAGGRPYFDLKGYISQRLQRSGVGALSVEPADTCADEARFFSYRRAVKRGERDYGRLLSAIVLEED